MKNLLNVIVLTLFCQIATAQTPAKKPDPNTVGLRYGLFFVNGFSNQVAVSGWLKKDFEVGVGFSLGYNQFNNTDKYPGIVKDINGIDKPAETVQKSISKDIVFRAAPFMHKHFFLTKSIDLYTGFFIPVDVRRMYSNNSTTTTSQDYLTTSKRTESIPVEIGIGAGITLGCNYFINRNFAIGAVTSISGVNYFRKGKSSYTTKYTYSGSLHPQNGEQMVVTDSYGNESRNWFSLNTAQSVGIVMSYYFGKKAKATAEPQ